MMVVDASVWVSFLVPQDVNHAISHQWLTKELLDGRPLVAPILLLAEVGGAIARRLGRDELGDKAINHLLAMPTLRLVSINHRLGIEASRLATRCRLRGADALYAAVAVELNIPLVSWDSEQISRVADLIPAYTPSLPY